jgi:enterochelin esterase family protein
MSTRKALCLLGVLVAGLAWSVSTVAADERLTLRSLGTRLAAKPSGDAADQLARAVREWFGADLSAEGASPRIEGLEAAWAIQAPQAKDAKIVTDDDRILPLVQVASSGVFVGTFSFADGTGFRWTYEVDGKRLRTGAFEVYADHPDNAPRAEVPKGKLTEQPKWRSKIFEGTERAWWLYVPQQYKAGSPACVMIFQDGSGYRKFVPTVFDNLIARGEMPVTVGIFLPPGKFPDGRSNRSFEYDTLSDQYARFLLEEILPEAEKTVQLRHDAASRAIAGASSGGICAWTAAWERPNEFGKVLSWVGSFTNIACGPSQREGGHNYEALIRRTSRKPIRVFLQDGSHDLDNTSGNWPLANQQMAKALAYKHYDYKFVYGQGFHNELHGRAILPDALRWLWREDQASTK